MDFKNQGKAKVFKHEDPRSRSLTYLEMGVYLYCNVDKVIASGFYCKLLPACAGNHWYFEFHCAEMLSRNTVMLYG